MKQNFDKDWRFFLGDLAPKTDTDGWGGAKAKAFNFGATKYDLDDSKWRKIDLPHDFVMEGQYTRNHTEGNDMQTIPEMESIDSRHFAGGSLEGGVAWYRKSFDLPQDLVGRRVYIHFDGVYRNSTLYFNEYLVDTHKCGYSSFFYDVTDFVRDGEKNVIAMRVDATGREGWWYEGGGIYRHVWLEIKEDVHIEPWGIFAKPEVNLEDKSADIEISTEVTNRKIGDTKITVKSTVKNADGAVVATAESDFDIPMWDTKIHKQNIHLTNANLWDTKSPYLYTLETEILDGDKVKDSEVTTFGLKHIRFDANKGFFLNGEHVKIKGICNHHDHAGVGIAANDEIQEYRLKQLMSMGANAYRSAHHQPTAELLDMCDRLGILVFDETRRMSSSPQDLEALRTLVKRDRNHPSVFLWGIGNEEVFCQDRPEVAKITVTMKTAVQKLDGTRPITSAVVCWNGVERFDNARSYIPVTKHLDVMGFNYCSIAWNDYHEVMPEQPVIITEEASNSGTRGCYSTDENKGHYYVYDPENENKCASGKKANKLEQGEMAWKNCADRDYMAGLFLWTGMDYRGEPTPLAYPAISSQFGIFDYCGFPKDNYYYYKSWWSDEDVLHIFPHWNFGEEGKPVNVHCYSNFDEVELLVNGKSYGKKAMEKNWYLMWENVIYEKGEVKAIGYRNGKAVMERTVKTTGKGHEIKLSAYKDEIGVDDTAIIRAEIVDENGNFVPTADNELTFEIDGGEFLGTGNGNPGSHESDKLPLRRAFNGLCMLLVKGTRNGNIKIKAKSNGLVCGEIVVKVK